MRTVQSSRSAVAHVFAIGNALIAIGVVIAVAVLPATSWFVVVPSGLVVALLLWSSFGLLRSTRWGLLALRACAWIALAIGMSALATLAMAAAQWSAARGGLTDSALTPLLGLALLLPYLLLYPCLQLLWAHRQQSYATEHA
jgi:hypothetical protein